MLRDFTYIDDIVEDVVRTLDRAPQANPTFATDEPDPAHSWAPYQALNIGNHGPAGLLDYVDALEEALGKRAGRNYLPMQPGAVPSRVADVEKLEQWTGHKPGTAVSPRRRAVRAPARRLQQCDFTPPTRRVLEAGSEETCSTGGIGARPQILGSIDSAGSTAAKWQTEKDI
jgi:hypothetical protein